MSEAQAMPAVLVTGASRRKIIFAISSRLPIVTQQLEARSYAKANP